MGAAFSRANFSDVKWGPLNIRFYPGLDVLKGGRALWLDSAKPWRGNSAIPGGDIAARAQHVTGIVTKSFQTGEKIDPAEVGGDVDEPMVIGSFRGGVAEYVRGFKESFAKVGLPKGYKYVIQSGMGANQMWTLAVAIANNADPQRRADVRLATTPLSFDQLRGLHQLETVPADAAPEQILWAIYSRSGKTAETLYTTEEAIRRTQYASALIFANGDRLRELAQGIIAQGGTGTKSLGLSERVSIPGRYMRAKTEVLMAVMAAACSDDFFNRYWTAAAEADASLLPVGPGALHMDIVRFINTFLNARNPEGSHQLYLCGNHPANVEMNNAWIQEHNEGAGKPGYSMVAFQGKGMPNEAHYNIEQMFNVARAGFSLGLFTFDIAGDPVELMLRRSINPSFVGLRPKDGIHALNVKNVEKWADIAPCIYVTYKEPTPEAMAYLAVLGENVFSHQLLFNGCNWGSNPEVRQVRKEGAPALEAVAAEGRKIAGIQ